MPEGLQLPNFVFPHAPKEIDLSSKANTNFDNITEDAREIIRDVVGAAIQAGDNIVISIDDIANTITITAERGIDVITDATLARTASNLDAYGYVRFTNAGDVVYTIDADNDLPVESVITVRDVSCGSFTIAAGVGVTVNPPFGGTLVSAGPGSTIQIVKVAANEYDVFGHVGAA